MKKILLFIGFVLMCTLIKAQDAHYYYYEGKKQYLTLNTEYAFLSLAETSIFDSINQFAVDIKELRSDNVTNKQYRSKRGKNRFYTELKLHRNLTKEQYLTKIADIKRLHPKAIISPYFKMGNDDKIGLSNFFYVKLKSESDTVLLEKMATQKKCTIIEQDQFMPLWFVLSTTELSELNAMETANAFYESGQFVAAEPNLMPSKILAANYPYYLHQWGLKNTGQYGGTSGIDINVVDAWAISKGNNVKVAIIDHGIELNHPGMASNIHSQSYDTENRSSPSIVRGSHGTACAGIVGAIQNTDGILGIAPNCKLISISNRLTTYINVQSDLAAGINWAWQNGADVISNSWGSNALQGSYITDAINNAVTQGRNGKGCIVAFASGNDNASSVPYPASLSNVLAVGAISPCGERKSPSSCDGETTWGSNYGTNLDVVAPGVLIPTTDIQGSAGYNPNLPIHPNNGGNKITSDYPNQDYTVWFNGTSAACPHVAGIAALVLSVNPSLTQAKVRQIIESTCTKLQEYSFSTNSNHPNGTWNSHAGHGLVDAYAAVQAAVNTVIMSGPAYVPCTGTVAYTSNVSGTWTVSPNLQIVNGQGTNTVTVRTTVPNNGALNSAATVSINGKTKAVTVGLPHVTSIEGPGIAPNGIFHFAARSNYPIPNMTDPDLYEWLVFSIPVVNNGVESITKRYNYAAIKITKPATYYVFCRSLNPCTGNSQTPIYITLTVTQNDLMPTYSTGSVNDSIGIGGSSSVWSSAYPNPASNELIIDRTEEESSIETSALNAQTAKGKASEVRVLLYSHSTARLVYNKTYQSSEKQIRIDVSKLPNGIYHLNMIENGEKVKEQTVMVNH